MISNFAPNIRIFPKQLKKWSK